LLDVSEARHAGRVAGAQRRLTLRARRRQRHRDSALEILRRLLDLRLTLGLHWQALSRLNPLLTLRRLSLCRLALLLWLQLWLRLRLGRLALRGLLSRRLGHILQRWLRLHLGRLALHGLLNGWLGHILQRRLRLRLGRLALHGLLNRRLGHILLRLRLRLRLLLGLLLLFDLGLRLRLRLGLCLLSRRLGLELRLRLHLLSGRLGLRRRLRLRLRFGRRRRRRRLGLRRSFRAGMLRILPALGRRVLRKNDRARRPSGRNIVRGQAPLHHRQDGHHRGGQQGIFSSHSHLQVLGQNLLPGVLAPLHPATYTLIRVFTRLSAYCGRTLMHRHG